MESQSFGFVVAAPQEIGVDRNKLQEYAKQLGIKDISMHMGSGLLRVPGSSDPSFSIAWVHCCAVCGR